jgi:hypothetical protein
MCEFKSRRICSRIDTLRTFDITYNGQTYVWHQIILRMYSPFIVCTWVGLAFFVQMYFFYCRSQTCPPHSLAMYRMRKKNLNSRFGDYFLTVCLLHFRGIRMPLLTILSAFKQKNRQRFIIFGSFFMWKKASWPSNMCHAVYDINLDSAHFKKGQKSGLLLSIFKVLQPICFKISANLLQKQVIMPINF